MNETGIVAVVLILINLVFTYQGLRSHVFFDRFKFDVDQILIYKDYKRIITAGFLHVNWMHFMFNMLSLYVFSGGIESYLGLISFSIIYWFCIRIWLLALNFIKNAYNILISNQIHTIY